MPDQCGWAHPTGASTHDAIDRQHQLQKSHAHLGRLSIQSVIWVLPRQRSREIPKGMPDASRALQDGHDLEPRARLLYNPRELE